LAGGIRREKIEENRQNADTLGQNTDMFLGQRPAKNHFFS